MVDPAQLIAEGKVMVTPGVYDVLSAKIAARVGFPAAVLTGYGVAASYLGEPDFGLFTATSCSTWPAASPPRSPSGWCSTTHH